MNDPKLPYINILQSAICVPPPSSGEVPIALDIKILPDKNIPPEPFFGVWLLDISGSMSGKRLKNAKTSIIEQVNILPAGSLFNLITFETDINEVMINVEINPNSRKNIIDKIQKISDRGTTALYKALEKGIDLVRKYVSKGNAFDIKKIILISDGDPTDVQVENGNEKDPNYQKYFHLAHEALEYRASIDTVGALGEHNVYLLYEIAKQSTGKYIFAEDADELRTKMIIATEQTIKIAFAQPSLVLNGKYEISVEDAVQYKPTVIRMPFERINAHESKANLRSFEAGDTYQILVKGKLKIDPNTVQLDTPINVLLLQFNFGKGLNVSKEISIKFSTDPSTFKLNQDINKKFANVFSQAEEIADCTIRGDAEATQRIQGDETKKIT